MSRNGRPALAECLTFIKDSHSNPDQNESAAQHLTLTVNGRWVAMSINTFNRIAISSSYEVAPTTRR